jgi:hypothetical protein
MRIWRAFEAISRDKTLLQRYINSLQAEKIRFGHRSRHYNEDRQLQAYEGYWRV